MRILTSVELFSQIKLSVSVCLFVCLYLCSPIFWEWLNIFFRNFGYGPLGHCWSSHKKFTPATNPREWDILSYFLHSSFSWGRFNISSWYFVKMFLVSLRYKNHSVALSAGSHFGLFLGSFYCIFQYFLRTVQHFLLKFYTDVLGILQQSLHYIFY